MIYLQNIINNYEQDSVNSVNRATFLCHETERLNKQCSRILNRNYYELKLILFHITN